MKIHPNEEENQKVLDASGKSSNSVHDPCAVSGTAVVSVAPSAVSRQKKKKSNVAILPRGVHPRDADASAPDRGERSGLTQTAANQESIMQLIKELTKHVSDDFKVTTVPLPGVLLRAHRHIKDVDALKLLIAFLMIVKNSSDFIDGKVVKHILSKELAGLDVNADDHIVAVLT